MPQAKARFVVVGKFIDAKGQPVKAGSLIDLEVDEDGKPVDALVASRVKPFKGEVIGEQPSGGVPADVKAQVDQYVAEAEEQAKAMTEQANKEALEVVEAAKAEAASILKAAGEEAERIINEATKTKK
jgi:inorganic pyrophosphatase